MFAKRFADFSSWMGASPKLVVTVTAIAVFVFHRYRPLDTIGLGILGIAMLPWVAALLTSAELPGGLKFEFRAVEEAQMRQSAELAWLRGINLRA